MSQLSKNQKITLLVIALFVVVEIVLFATGVLSFNGQTVDNNTPNEPEQNETVDEDEEISGIPTYGQEVDENATETQAQSEIDIGTEENEGAKRNAYNVTALSDGFSPDPLVVTKGNVINLTFSSDSGYDFFIPAYGIHLLDTEGNRTASFSASATGTFRIECRNSCPSDDEKIYGEFIVKPASEE